MKKLIVLALALILCIPLASYAASIGGAETQGKGKIAVATDNSFIFGRDLKFKKSSPALDADEQVKDTEIDSAYQVMLKASYGVLDNLDVYTKLGVADYKVKGDYYHSDSKYADDKVNSGAHFAYGFGLKGTYNLGNDWLVGCDLQYMRSSHKVKATETVVATGASSSSDYKTGIVQEWHVAPYVGYKMGNFVPYLGVRYSDMRMKIKSPAAAGWLDSIEYKADGNVGVFLGTDYKIGKNWKLNLEGRFVDETAMSFGATYRF